MKIIIITIVTILAIGAITPSASAEEIPQWVKNNAGWWANGDIGESDFVSGIQFLIENQIIVVPVTGASPAEKSDSIPQWVKNNAGWWANGDIGESDFVSGIQFLIETDIISVSTIETKNMQPEPQNIESESTNVDSELTALQAELEKCSEVKTAYKRIDCEKPVEKKMNLYKYKKDGQSFDLGPITYYWFGIGSEGNEFEITPTGQALLSIRMLAENTSSEIAALNCTSPSICAYDVWDGSKSFKYSGMDFTSGQIVLNPDDSREFNILFGPNIGYGGTEFEFDSSKTYQFRINEEFGSTSIELDLE